MIIHLCLIFASVVALACAFKPANKTALQHAVNKCLGYNSGSGTTCCADANGNVISEPSCQASHISDWDTSDISDMKRLFYQKYYFNADISAWDTSAVTDMSEMFYEAESFHADVAAWDTSTVRNMHDMFHKAEFFHADIGAWDTSAVTDMSRMFQEAFSFSADIRSWDTSAVKMDRKVGS